MKAYSTNLRERIVHTVKHEKNTPDETATRYKVSQSTVYNYLQLDRNLHNLTPKKSTRRTRRIPPSKNRFYASKSSRSPTTPSKCTAKPGSKPPA